MKNLIYLLMLFPIISFAGFEGEVGAYSNFIWRGTTFSENKPTVQLEIDAEEEHGFFVGGFVSNAEFSDEAMGSDANVTQEVDYMLGKRWSGKIWEIQASYNYFSFPGASVFNTDEFNLQGKIGSYLLELSYMDDYFGYQSNQKYVRLGKEWSFKGTILSTLYVGYNSFSNPKGSIRSRCLESTCTSIAETTSGAGNPDYIDAFFVTRKVLNEGMIVELALNWTNRKEYSVVEGSIELDKAKDFAVMAAFILPFSL